MRLIAYIEVLLLNCACFASAATTLEASNTIHDGQSFAVYSAAKFTCKIKPYTFSQTWIIDSVMVADCGFVLCVENKSNPATYSFMHDTTNGTFIFTIDPVTDLDNGKVIGCNDGKSTTNFNLTVKTVSDDADDRSQREILTTIRLVILVCLLIALMALTVACVVKMRKSKYRLISCFENRHRTGEDAEIVPLQKDELSYFITVITDDTRQKMSVDPIIVLHHYDMKAEARFSLSRNELKQGRFRYSSFDIELHERLSPLTGVEIKPIDSSAGSGLTWENILVYCPASGCFQHFTCHKPLDASTKMSAPSSRQEVSGRSWAEYLKHIAEMHDSSYLGPALLSGRIRYYITVVSDGKCVEINEDPIIILHGEKTMVKAEQLMSMNKLTQGGFSYYSFFIVLQQDLAPLSKVEIQLENGTEGLSSTFQRVIVYSPDSGYNKDFRTYAQSNPCEILPFKKSTKEKNRSWNEYLQHIAEMPLSSCRQRPVGNPSLNKPALKQRLTADDVRTRTISW